MIGAFLVSSVLSKLHAKQNMELELDKLDLTSEEKQSCSCYDGYGWKRACD